MELLKALNGAFSYCLESAICLAIFYLFYHFFLKKEKCFQYNRFYLLVTIIISISFPLIEVAYNPETAPKVLNAIHEVSSTEDVMVLPPMSVTITAKSTKPFLLWWEAVTLLYFLGVIILGLRLFIQIRTIQNFIWYKRHHTRFRKDLYLVKTQGTLPTFSWFSYLFWDNHQNLTSWETEQIMNHEKVHIRQKHSYDIMLIELLKVIFWFNPLFYLYKNTLEEIHEYEADHQVVSSNGSRKDYAGLLVRLVFSKMSFQMGSHFKKNKTLKRLDMMKKRKKLNPFRLLIPLPIACLLFFIISCEAMPVQKTVSIEQIEYISSTFGEKDIAPSPRTGFQRWAAYLKKNIQYPVAAGKQKLEGDVIVSFVIDKGGNLQQLTVEKDIGGGCDEAVIQALENAPKWNPGIKNGQLIDTKVKMPIHFKIS